ncbi:MAG: tyrosine-type recombinase/integrase [Planctomycetota bacterium]|jgi:site-specific recombinase XerD
MAKARKKRSRKRKKTNKGKRYPAEILTKAEVQSLLDSCSSKSYIGTRNRALIVVLYRAGLRIAEALALAPKDVDKAAGSLRILHGKGDKSRTVGMDKEAFESIETWMQWRTGLEVGDNDPVFCTLNGQALSTAYIRSLLPRLGGKAGIAKRVHAHGLRHTMAAEMLAEGYDVGTISMQLGHSNIATTATYLAHISPSAVIKAMQSRTWKA